MLSNNQLLDKKPPIAIANIRSANAPGRVTLAGMKVSEEATAEISGEGRRWKLRD